MEVPQAPENVFNNILPQQAATADGAAGDTARGIGVAVDPTCVICLQSNADTIIIPCGLWTHQRMQIG